MAGEAAERLKAELTLDCAAAEDPVLTEADLDAIVLGARRADASGVPAGAAGWIETYDPDAAKGRAWRIKQARVAGEQLRESVQGDYGADYRALEFSRAAERYERQSGYSAPFVDPA